MFFGVDTSSFMPHGHCILWAPKILLPIVISDVLIFFAYTSIPFGLYIIQKRRNDLTKNARTVFFLFFLFIQLCGITHLISAHNYWHSDYVLEMIFKVLTAIVSVLTAWTLFRLIPQLVSLPSPQEHLNLIEELKNVNKDLEKRVEERTKQIEDQKSLLETLVEGHQGAILRYEPIFDEQKKIIDFTTSSMNGRPHEEAGLESENQIIGKSLLQLFPEVVEMGHFENLIKSYETNTTIIEDPLFNPVLKRSFRVINFSKPDMNYLYVYFSDVTEREMEKINTLNNAKLISLGELAGGIAHEINTPLQLISGNVRKISRVIDKEKNDVDKPLKVISETVEKIGEIINNLKRLSRGDLDSKKACSINELIDKTISLYEQRLKLKEIHIEKTYQENKEFNFEVIEVSMFQIISNLFGNSIDALLEVKENRCIEISLLVDDKLILNISNNGPRIPEDVVDKIFDPMFTTKDIGMGTGLGLSLSRNLATEMGGTLSLINNENGLVTFSLEIG